MEQITFTNPSTGIEHGPFEGELIEEGETQIIREPHQGRPNWHLHPDGTIDLESKQIDILIEGFGEDGELI